MSNSGKQNPPHKTLPRLISSTQLILIRIDIFLSLLLFLFCGQFSIVETMSRLIYTWTATHELRSASFSVVIKPSFGRNSCKRLQVRAQCYRDEGNMVDANLRVLNERINMVRIKERLERCSRHEYGWNYAAGNDCKLDLSKALDQSSHLLELVGLVGGLVSLTIFSGSVGLYLVSMLVH